MKYCTQCMGYKTKYWALDFFVGLYFLWDSKFLLAEQDQGFTFMILHHWTDQKSGPEVVNFFHAQLNWYHAHKCWKCQQLLAFFTFISLKNTTSDSFKAWNTCIIIFRCFTFNEQLKCHAELNWTWFYFYKLGMHWAFGLSVRYCKSLSICDIKIWQILQTDILA